MPSFEDEISMKLSLALVGAASRAVLTALGTFLITKHYATPEAVESFTTSATALLVGVGSVLFSMTWAAINKKKVVAVHNEMVQEVKMARKGL